MQIAAEGILFASGEPVHISRLCMALDTDRPRAEEALQRLGDYYAFERRGIRLIRMEDSYQLCSAPEYAEIIRRAFEVRKTAKLSQPALEVLAIVAYYQPVTRAAPGAGAAPAVPHDPGISQGVSYCVSGGTAPAAGSGRERTAASGCAGTVGGGRRIDKHCRKKGGERL